ncbi:RNA-binding protein 44 [Leuresthes tenuis]|uniref:RNA-binding protein 44 n=1 Tax=Leuresthes tenuis TaxID=355514 RepID=UPI003B50635F
MQKHHSCFCPVSRSVFDLVAAHPALALTDTELLRWYLLLSPEDRKIILDEGGFHQFLQRHPGLKLSQGHVSVKYRVGGASRAQPTVTSSRHRCGSQEQLAEDTCCTPAIHEPDGFHQGAGFPLTQKPSLPKLSSSSSAGCSLSVDVELEGFRQRGDFTNPAVGPSQFGPQTRGAVGSAEEDATEEEGQGDAVCGLSSEDQTHKFHAIMEDESVLVCLAGEDLSANDGGVPSRPVAISSDPPTASCETREDQTFLRRNTAEKATSTTTPTCDVTVSTEPAPCTAPCTSAHTQTEAAATAEQQVITEIHMADMDYLTEEFIKLKMSKELKEKSKSSGRRVRTDCDCFQRAQSAELRLLALQYNMCRQHCWRLYQASAEPSQLTMLRNEHPANVIGILQKLDSDYDRMKRRLLTGVPLERLQPLSVDSEEVTTGARYTPAQVIGDMLGNLSSWTSREQQKPEAAAEVGRPDNRSQTDCQVVQRKVKPAKKEKDKTRRAATLVPSGRRLNHSQKQEKQLTGAREDVSCMELWFDAEEDLRHPEPAAEIQPDPDSARECVGEEAGGSELCVLQGCSRADPSSTSTSQLHLSAPAPACGPKGACTP